jgi:hypothetical protein
MVQLHLTEDELESLGLNHAGFSQEKIDRSNKATNDRRLKDFCYAGPKTLLDLLRDLQDPTLGEYRIRNPNPSHLIHTLYFLKKYPTVHEFAGRCGDGTEKTVVNRAWTYIRAIQALKAKKIQWIFDDDNNHDEFFILSVDGVHCRIYEPRTQPSAGWYSKKFAGPGLTYELGVAIHHDKIVWINGPFPAAQHDITVFRKPGGLKSKIPPNHLAIGDQGYQGEPSKISTKNPLNSIELNKWKSRVRARHETVNSRLKAFGILDQAFRTNGNQRMEKHKSAFEACCVIIQYELDNGSKLFMV